MSSVAVIGAGAVGAIAAGSAVAGGHEVTLCVRTPFDRLVIRRNGVDHAIDACVATDPASLRPGPVDVAVLAVKVQDTPSVAPWLDRLCGPATVVVTMQNGLDPSLRIAALSPAAAGATIVPTVIYIAAERDGPGRVTHHFANRMIVKPGPGAGAVEPALGAELQVSVSEDFTTAVWRKLVDNVVVNPITALTLRRVDVLAEPAIRDLLEALVSEAVAVAAADGAALGDDDVRAVMATYTGDWSTQSSGSSMYYDRVAGRPLEHEALTGALVETGCRLGVRVPHHETVLALLRVLDPASEGALYRSGG